jgi:hypothetical protein
MRRLATFKTADRLLRAAAPGNPAGAATPAGARS